jgi:hypothetical protein
VQGATEGTKEGPDHHRTDHAADHAYWFPRPIDRTSIAYKGRDQT